MNCANLIDSLGYRCATVGNVTVVSTPYRMACGSGIPAYLEPIGEQIHITDEGEILFAIMASGIKLRTLRSTQGIRNILKKYDVNLNEAGVIETICPVDALTEGYQRFIAGCLAVAEWQRDSFARGDEARLEDDVKAILRLRDERLEEHPEPVTGLSGKRHHFAFSQGGVLIDCVSVHQTAIAHEARKLLDVRNRASNHDLDIEIVIDDRRADPKAAREEASVLSSLAPTVMFTKLAKNVSRAH